MSLIVARGLTKVYRVPVKEPGLSGSLRSLFARKFREVRAVDDVSFAIDAGERVGFLGPNGAGKTTTLKMCSGLLHPTAGEIRVGGHVPQAREAAFLRQITLVMGQKQQLLWDLPARETFELNRAMYGVDRGQFRRTMDELVAMLRIEPLLDKPVRNLSLGERMKCELVCALVHRPSVMFLDEPTIGLDVEMQAQVRAFVKDCNERLGATVLLTSHYMADIAALTPRLLIIDQGRMKYDGALSALAARVAPERRVVVRTEKDISDLGFSREEGAWVSRSRPEDVNPLLGRLFAVDPLAEVGVEAEPLESIMARVFREGAA